MTLNSDDTAEDLRGERALEQARSIPDNIATCPTCGAVPGRPCYQNRAYTHPLRLAAARTEALARALLWIDEFRGSVAAARSQYWDSMTMLQDLDRILSPSVESYLRGDAN